MSMDFTGVTDITIPEGKVVKITRKSDGSVVWEKPVSDVVINLTNTASTAIQQHILVNDTVISEAGQYTYPFGQEIEIVVRGASTSNYILIDGMRVAEGLGSVSYTYAVKQNINVYFGAIQQGAYKWISITFAE